LTSKRKLKERSKGFRIPSILHLPFGYRINIYQTTRANMGKVTNAKSLADIPVAYHIHFGYRSEIWLLRHRSHELKLDDFFHELVHAINDY
jgi:hypothetical protein